MRVKSLSKSVIAKRSTGFWLNDVAISFTQSVILRSVLCDVRISSTRSVIARRLTVFWLDDVAISSVKIFLSKR
jgi:hypothetical protein